MASIELDRVSKVFPDGTRAVDDLSLRVEDGELTVLVGPSGSGKSTALRLVAGLEEVTGGTIRIDERDVTDIAPKDRDIAMVFQSYALYPHMTVADNLAFGLRLRDVSPHERRERVRAVAERLGIDTLLARRPRELSGGQRQRVALGRAIVRDPAAFLMDEPLSNLDAKLRVEMRSYLSQLQQELGATTLYVTHDQTEAMTMGDRVAVMRDGRLEQFDTPQALYEHPANVFVATFMGSPAMNLLRVDVHDGRWAQLGAQRLRLPGPALDRPRATLGIRPESFSLANGEAPEGEVIELPVRLVEALGSDLLVHLESDQAATGSVLDMVTARLPPRAPVQAGGHVRLRVDVDALRLFDAETGRALR
jgi:multiple sugar transport system ATP-binding protein